MAFPSIQENSNDNHHHQQQQQLPDSHNLVEENIDNHHTGTSPLKFLPLHHVYSATSPRLNNFNLPDITLQNIHQQEQLHCRSGEAEELTGDDIIQDRQQRRQPQRHCRGDDGVELTVSDSVTRVYSRRNSDSTLCVVKKSLFDSIVKGLDEVVVVKAEPVEEEEEETVVVDLPNKRRRVCDSRRGKLGLDCSTTLSRSNPARLQRNMTKARELNVNKRKQNSRPKSKNRGDWKVKKWFKLFFDGVDPMVFVGLKCQVYWPLDDDWYKGSISGYDTNTKNHNVKYDDGEEETLILSREQIKFHLSGSEMQDLNLIGKELKDDDDPDYNQLFAMATSVDDSREPEVGDVIWAKLSGHAMWPAIIMDESLVSDGNKLNKSSGKKSVPVQFFGSYDFARIQVKHIVSLVKGLFSCFHLKCKSSRFYRSLKEVKLYLNENILPKSMRSMQRESMDVQTIELVEASKSSEDLSNSKGTLEHSIQKDIWEKCQTLPGGRRPIVVNWKDLDRCSVCHMDEEYENNLFLQCDTCRMMVHARCYGEVCVDGGLWLCNMCRLGAPESIPLCRLCPIVGGAMKPTTDGHWAHLACAMWIPETCLLDIKRMEPIDGLTRINKDRWKLLCSICNIPYGACIQCSNSTCYVAYHPLCARVSGYCVELEDEDKLLLMSADDVEEEQCIRLVSFCSKHKQPSNVRPIVDDGTSCQDLIYESQSNLSGCARCEPYNYSSRRGRKEPEVLVAASAKRAFLENKAHLVGGFCLNDSPAHISAKGNLGVNQEAPLSIFSMADKYRYMRETFKKRLAFGKSKIHGFGIFARQPHKAGDMVIEYTGEIVRPSVADRREHLIYNSLVGAGTYMFRIDDERVIDATRSGSIAHLINHSCDPNCYSRVISVCGDDHIIIFAKREINQMEELTYDYRFFSKDVKLPCSCGAKGCRGVVNDIEAEEQAAKLYVPRSELIDWKGQ